MANAAILKNIVLEVESRETTGSTAGRRMRREGRVPGNVYGLDRPPFKVSVNPKRIDEVLRLGSGVNTMFQLALAGENKTRDAMIKELQRDPVTDLPVHIDFIRVDPTKTVQVSVPVQLVGMPEGVKNEAGVVDFVNRVVQVECLPTHIPEHFDVDVSALHINQHVSVSDLSIGEGVKLLDYPDQILAVVVAPRVEEVAATDEEAEIAEDEAAEGAEEKEGAAGEASADAENKKEG
ncbi:MAG: 50S ribosomal protein L25 [Deltaproteobacteria bacterium]|nr:50S ribosomal protein L25 [Deltaproteobacteria bacterium]